MDTMYLLYSYYETNYENDGLVSDNIEHRGLYRSKEDAIKELNRLVQNIAEEGELIQTNENENEYSKQITDDESYWHVYVVKTMIVNKQ